MSKSRNEWRELVYVTLLLSLLVITIF